MININRPKKPKNKRVFSLSSISTRKQTSQILKAISNSLDTPITYTDLINKHQAEECQIEIILNFLLLFNVINIEEKDNETLIKPVNEIASFFIKSISIYISSNIPLVGSWEHPYRSGELNISDFMNYGNQLLYSIEQRRISIEKNPMPTSTVKLSLILISAKTEPDQEVRYLMQYNIKRLTFQLIGGYQNSNDLSDEDTIFRHLKKDLPLNELDKTNTSIKRLFNPIQGKSISIKTGAFTEYHIDLYHLTIVSKNLILQKEDRWLTLSEILSGNTSDGYPIMFPIQDIQNNEGKEEFVNTIKQLPLSLGFIQKNVVSNKGLKKGSTVITSKEKSKESFDLKDESEFREYKLSIRWDHRMGAFNKELEFICIKVISSFMNCRGGELVIGVTDNKDVVGITSDLQTLKKKNQDGYTQHIMNLITSYLGNEFASFVEVSYDFINNNPICIIKVYPSPKPVFVKRGELREFCIRTNNSSRSLNSEDTYQFIQLHW